MGNDEGVSIEAKVASGLIIGDGGYTGPFPSSTTDLVGAEVGLSLVNGKAALTYYRGYSEDTFSQDSLPIPQSLRDLFQFSSKRNATFDFGFLEWAWSHKPFYTKSKFALLRPETSFGLGAFRVRTTIAGEQSRVITDFNFVGTGSIRLNLVELGPVSLSLGVRMFAGEAFAMMVEGGPRITF